jgi:dolichol-phosphate mannosyltransferase
VKKIRINKFSIILPVLNEKKNIEKLIFLIRKYLKGYIFEIIFIDDNSLDGTRDIIEKYISKKIKYILRRSNHDLTLSCFLGIQKSKYKNIIIMDSDLQHDPKYLPKIINLYFFL